MGSKTYWVTTESKATVVERWMFRVPEDFDGDVEQAFHMYPNDGLRLDFQDQKVTNETDRKVLSFELVDDEGPATRN